MKVTTESHQTEERRKKYIIYNTANIYLSIYNIYSSLKWTIELVNE